MGGGEVGSGWGWMGGVLGRREGVGSPSIISWLNGGRGVADLSSCDGFFVDDSWAGWVVNRECTLYLRLVIGFCCGTRTCVEFFVALLLLSGTGVDFVIQKQIIFLEIHLVCLPTYACVYV